MLATTAISPATLRAISAITVNVVTALNFSACADVVAKTKIQAEITRDLIENILNYFTEIVIINLHMRIIRNCKAYCESIAAI
jgi:hypothetical protein